MATSMLKRIVKIKYFQPGKQIYLIFFVSFFSFGINRCVHWIHHPWAESPRRHQPSGPARAYSNHLVVPSSSPTHCWKSVPAINIWVTFCLLRYVLFILRVCQLPLTSSLLLLRSEADGRSRSGECVSWLLVALLFFHFPLASLVFMLELLQSNATSTPGWPMGSGSGKAKDHWNLETHLPVCLTTPGSPVPLTFRLSVPSPSR